MNLPIRENAFFFKKTTSCEKLTKINDPSVEKNPSFHLGWRILTVPIARTEEE